MPPYSELACRFKRQTKAVLLLFFAFFGSNVLWANNKDQISVGVEIINNPPFYYLTPQGNYQGLVNDIMQLFAQSTESQLHYNPQPVTRLFYDLIRSKVDLKVPDNPKWRPDLKQNHTILYSDAFLQITVGLVGIGHSSATPLKQIKHISMPLGYTLVHLTPAQKQNLIIHQTHSIES